MDDPPPPTERPYFLRLETKERQEITTVPLRLRSRRPMDLVMFDPERGVRIKHTGRFDHAVVSDVDGVELFWLSADAFYHMFGYGSARGVLMKEGELFTLEEMRIHMPFEENDGD